MPNPYDPRGLFTHAVDAARAGLDVYSWTEKQVVGALRQGLDKLDSKDALEAGAHDDDTTDTAETAEPDPASLSGKMSHLLGRALEQNTAGSQVELYHHLLDQLVADEARILGALSDGSASPVVNVYSWNQSRTPGRALLENASLIGRTANIALPQLISQYVGHLLSLGLVEIRPEDPALHTEYEVLLAESSVLAAIKRGTRGPMPAKVEKFALTLSPLGVSLWLAATEDSDHG